MTTKLIAVPNKMSISKTSPKQDVHQKDVRQKDAPKDVHKQAVPKQDRHQQVEPAEYLAVFPEYPRDAI